MICFTITSYKKKSFSGEAKDSAIFPFYFLLHKRAKPILPHCVHFSNHKSIKTYTPPLQGMSCKKNAAGQEGALTDRCEDARQSVRGCSRQQRMRPRNWRLQQRK
jgi:hypothetical protein